MVICGRHLHRPIPVGSCLRAPLLTLSCCLRVCSASRAASLPTLEWTVFTMPLALLPKRRELSVSAASSEAGEQQMMRAVCAEPPRLSCRTLVSCRVAAQISPARVEEGLAWRIAPVAEQGCSEASLAECQTQAALRQHAGEFVTQPVLQDSGELQDALKTWPLACLWRKHGSTECQTLLSL